MITLGGDAELELVDSLDPFSEVGALTALKGGSRVLITSCVLLGKPAEGWDLGLPASRTSTTPEIPRV